MNSNSKKIVEHLIKQIDINIDNKTNKESIDILQGIADHIVATLSSFGVDY